jgi:hypothetical protein
MTTFPNTGSQIERVNDQGQTTTGLSTQIVIKVANQPVGALQRLTISQNRPLARIREIGVDGVIEIVPQGATEYELTAERVVFDQLRIPEAFTRGFRFIAAQRIPFDIEVYDMSNMEPNETLESTSSGLIIMTYKNCWFTRYETPYQAENYIITETANIWAETAYVSFPVDELPSDLRDLPRQYDQAGVEKEVNSGYRRGALDASGIVNSVFNI